MKLDELESLWANDAAIDSTYLDRESLKTPQLHSKYFKMYSQERLRLKKMDSDYKKLYLAKWEYYTGKMSDEELQEYGWEPFLKNVLRQDVSIYIEADTDIRDTLLKVAVQKQKVDFIEDVIKQLNKRSFDIKNAIEWQKFTNGLQ
jgi:hypothetical protein